MTTGDHQECVAPTATTAHTLGHLGMSEETPASSETDKLVDRKRKTRDGGAAQNEKLGPRLREISIKVCQIVQSKGRTTYNEVAEELVAEYENVFNGLGSDDQKKSTNNIMRRVYDALNVLLAMDMIEKDNKEIVWKGMAQPTYYDFQVLKWERGQVKERIEKKSAYLEELQEQVEGYQHLARRNQELYRNRSVPNDGVALPFILVQTRPSASIEVEVSEDMKLVHLDFHSTPFELLDDVYVLKQIRMCKQPQT